MKKNIVIAGKSDLACLSLIWLQTRNDFENLSILPSKTDLDENSWQLSLKKTAEKLNVNILNSIDDIYHDRFLLFISMEYDSLIDTSKFHSNMLFNIHFSLLPRYKGVYTSIFPILNNDSESGVTLHLIEDNIDGGKIIDQSAFHIGDLNSYELYKKYIKEGFKLFKSNFTNLINEDYNLRDQSCNEDSIYYRKDLDFNQKDLTENKIKNKTINEVFNIIRAFYFKPYQRPTLFGKTIMKYSMIDDSVSNLDFRIDKISENQYLLKLLDGVLYVELEGD